MLIKLVNSSKMEFLLNTDNILEVSPITPSADGINSVIITDKLNKDGDMISYRVPQTVSDIYQMIEKK